MRLWFVIGLALAGLLPWAARAADDDAASATRGRLIYETGQRADGRPVQARREYIGKVPAAAVACSGCHRRSALGNQEAGLLVPALAGERLFAPVHRPSMGRAHPSLKRQELRAYDRPAYDMASLARALAQGLDSAGRHLDAAMPRYQLSRADVIDLVAYLRSIGRQPPPGLGTGQMRLASVITPDAPAAARNTVKAVMAAWAQRMQIGPWRVSWRAWELQGEPATWPAQMQAFWAQEDVFALVSGAGAANWQGVAAFCERKEISCIFPTLEATPTTAASHYFSAYLSGGVQAEAALLANHAIARREKPGLRLVSVADPADASAQAGHRALTSSAAGMGLRSLPVNGEAALALSLLGSGEAAVLWLRPDQLNRLFSSIAPRPGLRLWLSATLAPPHNVSVPPAWQPHVAWLSLHSDQVRRQAGGAVSLEPWAQRLTLPTGLDPVVMADVHAAAIFFTDSLGRAREGLSAAYLMERLESSVDQRPAGAGYFRLSLAPGQRVAAQYGHILLFDHGRLVPSGELVPAPAVNR